MDLYGMTEKFEISERYVKIYSKYNSYTVCPYYFLKNWGQSRP